MKRKQLKPFKEIWIPILAEEFESKDSNNNKFKNKNIENDIEESTIFEWVNAVDWAKELIEEYERTHSESDENR